MPPDQTADHPRTRTWAEARNEDRQAVAAAWEDTLHFGQDNCFTGNRLATRIINLIEERHRDYFCGSGRGANNDAQS